MVLESVGVPQQVRRLIAALYKDCTALITVNGQTTGDFKVLSGIKQGCPLSGTLFVIAVDPLLRALCSRHMAPPSLLSGYADDLALVLYDLFAELPPICALLDKWRLASALALNIGKCVVVPLWRAAIDVVRGRLRGLVPAFADCTISFYAVYLGVALGPAAQHHLWDGASSRCSQAASRVRLADRGLATKFLQFNIYAMSTLAFKLQFHSPTSSLRKLFRHGAQRMLRRPWHALPHDLLLRLPALGFPKGIEDLDRLSLACRARVAACSDSFAAATARIDDTINRSDDRLLRAHYCDWQHHTVIGQLRTALTTLSGSPECSALLNARPADLRQIPLQKRLLRQLSGKPRVDAKLVSILERRCARWTTTPSALVAHLVSFFEGSKLPCTVRFSVLTLAMNAWITARRFQTTSPCVFGCRCGNDEVEHYFACPAVRPDLCTFFSRIRALQHSPLSIEYLLMRVGHAGDGPWVALYIDAVHDASRIARHFGQMAVPGALAARLRVLLRRWPALRALHAVAHMAR